MKRPPGKSHQTSGSAEKKGDGQERWMEKSRLEEKNLPPHRLRSIRGNVTTRRGDQARSAGPEKTNTLGQCRRDHGEESLCETSTEE